jgi:hypothetical protein
MATKTILKVKNIKVNVSSNGHEVPTSRLDVRKTYKLYIDGKFPRTESGRVVCPERCFRKIDRQCLSWFSKGFA